MTRVRLKRTFPSPGEIRAFSYIFNHYTLHHNLIGFPIEDDWLSITPEDFDRY